MTRRDDSKAETSRLILSAAKKLFWEKGPENCTIRSIAQKAGVAPASVIVHFKNKTALLEATLYEDIEAVLNEKLDTYPIEGGLSVICAHFLSDMFFLYDKNRELYRVLIRDTLFEFAHNSPKIAQLDEKYFTFLAELIEKEKKLGTIRPEVESNLVAQALFSLYMGVLREFLRNPELSAEKAMEQLSTMLEYQLTGVLLPEDN
ncbi:MAG: TetR/AcrR family transcriptional regulator [Desulfotalea sp.]